LVKSDRKRFVGDDKFCLSISDRECVVNKDGTASERNVVGPSKSFEVKCSRQTLNVDVDGDIEICSKPHASSHLRAIIGSRGILYNCTR